MIRRSSLLCSSSAGSHSALFRCTPLLLKKIGKPLETPDYKQVYLPYEKAPSQREIDAARRQYETCPDFTSTNYSKRIRVLDVPKNMYTYGKEGSTVPISIFKDQDDPVIGPEHTYPGIYELKRSLRHKSMADLFHMQETNTFESPFQKEMFHDELDAKQELVYKKMRWAALRNFRTKYQKDRKSGPGSKAAAAKTADGGAAATPKDAAAKDPDKKK